jgi:SAM-dependent MidA family methyltransferase
MNTQTQKVYNEIVNATPQSRVVRNNDPFYNEIIDIEEDEWVELLDKLAENGITIKYNNNDDSFVIG